VNEGDLIFSLSESPELEQLQAIEAEIEQATWKLKDLEKGLRVNDLAYLQANTDSAKADVHYWEQNLARLEQLSSESRSQDEMDQAKQSLDKANAVLNASKAKLKSGKLGERSDIVMAKRAAVKQLKARQKELQWYMQQKKRNISFSGRVKEIHYEVGEWISAYQPIMTVEDVSRRYVVFYLNQVELNEIAMGDSVTVLSANKSRSVAKIVYISDHAEFTPPIVYTISQGELYRFKVKAELQSSRFLHPGQPVIIELR
jgi:HlyD family secretion protein